MHSIFVYIEKKNNFIRDVSLELLSHANTALGDMSGEVCAIYPSHELNDDIKEELFKYGAHKIYFIKNEKLSDYNELYFANAVIELVKIKKPDIMLFPATKTGRSLAPKISSSLNTGLTADCTGLEFIEQDGKIKLASTRPTFGGSLMATILCKRDPQMATAREHVFKKTVTNNNYGIVEEFSSDLSSIESSLKILDFVSSGGSDTDGFLGAEVILGGGLGLGNKENFEKLKKLSLLMKCSYGATRAAVDKGFAAKDRQIGQTGKTIAPKIYIAFGISGAIQHLCGVENSDYIVAINNDKNAPIFSNCDLGFVGDASEVLDNLILILDKTH